MAKRKSAAGAETETLIELSKDDVLPRTRTKAQKRAKPATYEPTDEFQQVTDEGYIRRHRVRDLGYGADVLAQDHVSSCSNIKSTDLEFIDEETANAWYDELLGMDTCALAPASMSLYSLLTPGCEFITSLRPCLTLQISPC